MAEPGQLVVIEQPENFGQLTYTLNQPADVGYLPPLQQMIMRGALIAARTAQDGHDSRMREIAEELHRQAEQQGTSQTTMTHLVGWMGQLNERISEISQASSARAENLAENLTRWCQNMDSQINGLQNYVGDMGRAINEVDAKHYSIDDLGFIVDERVAIGLDWNKTEMGMEEALGDIQWLKSTIDEIQGANEQNRLASLEAQEAAKKALEKLHSAQISDNSTNEKIVSLGTIIEAQKIAIEGITENIVSLKTDSKTENIRLGAEIAQIRQTLGTITPDLVKATQMGEKLTHLASQMENVQRDIGEIRQMARDAITRANDSQQTLVTIMDHLRAHGRHLDEVTRMVERDHETLASLSVGKESKDPSEPNIASSSNDLVWAAKLDVLIAQQTKMQESQASFETQMTETIREMKQPTEENKKQVAHELATAIND